jgi:peptide/histidine transporter 3/4
MSNEEAVNQFYAWNGFVYVTPLIGGYIADSFLGRYKTILYFSCLYLIGLGLFVFGSVPGAIVQGLIFTAMYTVALGAGGIKPNVSTMGADQFNPDIPQDKKESQQFFSYFYWSINLGALIAYSLVAYVCQYGLPFLGGESWGFFVGYLIPTIMMCFGVAVFVSGSKLYKKVMPKGSMLSTAGGIVYEALITKWSETSPTGYVLDKANQNYGGSYNSNDVEGVKFVAKLTPFLAVMIPYWGIYGQTKTAFQIQGCQMDSKLGDFQLPISAMNMFNNVAILILVPLTDQVIYPKLKEKGFKLSMLTKIGWGFVFAVLAMVMAALIELYRMEEAPSAGNYYDVSARDNISPCRNIDNYNPYQYQEWYAGDDVSKPLNCHATCDTLNAEGLLSLDCIDCDDIPQMSAISIFWQVPQFVLIGISEIFASITSLEFFYSQAPSRMRSVSQASNLFTNALGSWLTIPLTLLVNVNKNHQWVTSNVDEGNLQAYFYLLAGLMSGALIVFYHLANGYVYADPLQLAALDHVDHSDVQISLLPTEEPDDDDDAAIKK